MLQLFHVYIGKAYQGPIRALNEAEACRLYAKKTDTSVFVYHAEPASTVRQQKEPALRKD